MKKSTNRNIKAILSRYFLSIFSVLAVTVLICGIEYSGDRSRFQMTGEHYETITFSEIKEALFNFIYDNKIK